MSERGLGDRVNDQMNRPDIHDVWEATYRTAGNERLFEQCFDTIVARVRHPAGSRALDVGCGIGANSCRLARRGYRVEAGDWSEPILERARARLAAQGLAERVRVTRQDVTALDFPDATFDLTLCWGVLMHVPDMERALAELVRVTRPGGHLVFEEVNVRSPEAALDRLGWRISSLLRDKKIEPTRTPGRNRPHGRLPGREALLAPDPHPVARPPSRRAWLHGARRSRRDVHRAPLRGPTALQRPVDAWNRWYHRRIGAAALAKHFILIARKG